MKHMSKELIEAARQCADDGDIYTLVDIIDADDMAELCRLALVGLEAEHAAKRGEV